MWTWKFTPMLSLNKPLPWILPGWEEGRDVLFYSVLFIKHPLYPAMAKTAIAKRNPRQLCYVANTGRRQLGCDVGRGQKQCCENP